MTAESYSKFLNEIEKKNPAEALLPQLRKGLSRINAIYMATALGRLPNEEEAAEYQADDVLRGLWRERTRLFGEMNKQSNEFHSCLTDAARGENSRRVLLIWDQILAVKAKISHYQEYGELPQTENEDILPDNAVALGKKIASLRVQISQCRKVLVGLAGLDPGTPNLKEKVSKGEERLANLRHLLGLAEQKLKTHEEA